MPRSVVVTLVIAVAAGCAGHHQRDASARVLAVMSVENARLGNLQRAARYPWKDDGRCAVAEASATWAVLVDRCFDALDLSRIRFDERQGDCPLAQADATSAEEALRVLRVCLLARPEVAATAVIILGPVAVAGAIAAEIEAAEARKGPQIRSASASTSPQAVKLVYNADGNCKNLPGEDALYKEMEYSVSVVHAQPLFWCILRQIENAHIDCGLATKIKCALRNGGKEGRAIGGSAPQGTYSTPKEDVEWCDLENKSKECQAKGLIHEMAHTCGWDHGQGGGVPGDNGHLICQ